MIFLTVEEVIDFHTDMILEFGLVHGIRDMGLLISAVEMPKTMMFGEYLHPTIFDQGSAYLYHLIGNHPFIDDNKRTAIITCLTFFKANEIKLKYDSFILEELAIQIASEKIRKCQISLFFENCYQ